MTRQLEATPSAGRNAVIQMVAALAITLVIVTAIALNLAVLDSGADEPSGAPVAIGGTN